MSGTLARQAERRLQAGQPVGIPRSLPYRALARTCKNCMKLITTPDHLIRKDAGKWQCPKCNHASKLRSNRKRYNSDPEFRRYWSAKKPSVGRTRRDQAETLDRATRRYVEWTGPELEVIGRGDLTIRQQALMLGRTYAAVHMMRRKLRNPREGRLAGLAIGATVRAQARGAS